MRWAVLSASLLTPEAAMAVRAQAVPATGAVAGCAADPGLPAFEVAAITPVAEKDRGYTQIGDSGQPRYTVRNASLSLLISMAFQVQPQNFVDAPKGLDDAYFDVRVESADGVPLTYEALKPRLQQMLEQRFCLRTHAGTRQVAGYALVVGRGGPKVMPVTETDQKAGGAIMEHEIRATAMNMGAFATMLGSPAGRPVRDDTGLQGIYTFQIQFAPPADTTSTLPSLFTAVREQLGLELKPAQVTVPTLRIEHLSLLPTEN